MTVGFHAGELAVQRRAGVPTEAARLVGMLAPPRLDGRVAGFLGRRSVAVLTARDRSGRLWTSPMTGPPGFLDAHGTTLDVHGGPVAGDPLSELPAGRQVGMLAIEFAIRRRMRVNGLLSAVGPGGFTIEVEQAFGNCPSYIQQRSLDPVPAVASEVDPWAVIRAADTFFLGTTHPTRGADTSHKGGPAGFVRVSNGELWWPDYAGNNMFNSMGNIEVNPEAALLFVDLERGTTVHLSGQASLEWLTPGAPGDDGETGRRVHFRPERIVTGTLPVRGSEPVPSPHNPALR